MFRSILLVGKRGTGKTTLGYLVGNHYDLPVIEINASDERRKEDFGRIWKAASTSSLGSTKNLILLDESDGLTKTMQKKLVGLCKTTPSPIVICANDEFRINKDIREISLVIKFYEPYSLKENFLPRKLTIINTPQQDNLDIQHILVCLA